MLGFLTVLPNDYRISEPYYYLKPFVEILFTTMSGDKSTPSTKGKSVFDGTCAIEYVVLCTIVSVATCAIHIFCEGMYVGWEMKYTS